MTSDVSIVTKEDHICINKKLRINQFHFATKNDFFKTNNIQVKVFENYIVFNKCSIDYRGKAYNPTIKNNGWSQFTIKSEYDIITGIFNPDKEESNEDQLVIYYK